MIDADLPQRTAVIVEDDPDVRDLLAHVLEAAGFSTVTAENGIDGVQAVLTHQPLITTLGREHAGHRRFRGCAAHSRGQRHVHHHAHRPR